MPNRLYVSILLAALLIVVASVACGEEETSSIPSTRPISSTAPIPSISTWPCSERLDNGMRVYPTLVNEAKKYAAPFSIGSDWGTGSSGGLSSDGRYTVTFDWKTFDVSHTVEGLLDPVTCEMTPIEIRKYDSYNRVIDRLELETH